MKPVKVILAVAGFLQVGCLPDIHSLLKVSIKTTVWAHCFKSFGCTLGSL